jgi:diguanylate cyclase (GGDEF)-like protein
LVDLLLGLLGSSIALCCACVLAVYFTEHGYGPFAIPAAGALARDLELQIYLGFHLIGFLPVSILFLQRRWLEGELRDSLAHTTALASLDSLTDLANRRTLDRHLEEQWRLCTRAQMSLAVLRVDADHFKQFNDRFGHRAGDECLCAIARALRKHVTRPSDLVGRFGGEEFAVILPNTSLQGAHKVAEAIRTTVDALTTTGGPRITVSIGCAALIPRGTNRSHRLIEAADQALYRAKRNGRNQVCVAEEDPQMWTSGTAARKLRERLQAYHRQRRDSAQD